LAGLIQHSGTGYFYVFAVALIACLGMHRVTMKAIEKFMVMHANKSASH
jgi:hypothetical protein